MHFDTFDSPRPGLGGSHHLPPYSILCSSPPRLHPNGSFSQDSQGEVPKLSRVGIPRIWELTSPDCDMRHATGARSQPKLYLSLRAFQAMSHSFCKRWEEVNSRLLVVGSQTTNLTPGPSFAHNLGWRCPNGSYEAILDIYTSKPFRWHNEHPNAKRFGPCN
jgi:hypothetical protein